MPRTLTTPIVKNATIATVDSWGISLVRKTDLSVDKTQTIFSVGGSIRFADGSIASQSVVNMIFSQLPLAAQQALATFHASVIAYLQSNGTIPAGTDVADL